VISQPADAAAARRVPTRSLVRIVRTNQTLARALKITASLLGFLLLWELCCWILQIPEFLLPSPSTTIRTVFERWDLFAKHSVTTFYETVIGFLMAVAFGVFIAALIVVIPMLSDIVMPLLLISQLVPKVAIAPILLIWFGYGLFPKIFIAFLIAFFPIVVNTASGLASVERPMLDLARSLEATRWQIFIKFRVPVALPEMFSGMKIAITLAVIGAIIGEFVGGSAGLGYLILIANSELDTPLAFAALLLLSIGGIALYMGVELLERIVIPWNKSALGDFRPVVGG
jgi:NitT/TauT family transport system permease protein